MKKFSWKERGNSFRFAFDGIQQFFQTQHNAWLHLLATAVVITTGFIVHLTKIEWLFITGTIALVWMAELFNTAIEKLCDMMTTEWNLHIKFIKDVSAAAVLVAATTALITGLIIFIPKFF